MGRGDELDKEMVAKAEAVIAGMRDAYLAWAAEDLRKLNVLCGEIAATPPAERPLLMIKVFTIAHDVKGQGGSFGYGLMTTVGNQLCRFVEARTDWPDESLPPVFRMIADMKRILEDGLDGDGGEAGAALLRELRTVVEAAGGPLTLT